MFTHVGFKHGVVTARSTTTRTDLGCQVRAVILASHQVLVHWVLSGDTPDCAEKLGTSMAEFAENFGAERPYPLRDGRPKLCSSGPDGVRDGTKGGSP